MQYSVALHCSCFSQLANGLAATQIPFSKKGLLESANEQSSDFEIIRQEPFLALLLKTHLRYKGFSINKQSSSFEQILQLFEERLKIGFNSSTY